MKYQVHYQMTLSAPQLNYLSESKYHKNRMAFFLDLVNSAVLKPTKSQVCGCDETINIGQVEKSEVQLAKDWDCDRKTVSKVIAKMNELGIITTKKSNRTSVHTIHPVAAWIVDNIRIKNPYFRTGYVYNQIREGNFDSTSFMSQLNVDKNGASMNRTCDKDSHSKGSMTNQTLPTIHSIEIFKKREERNSNHSKANEPENVEPGNTYCLQ